MPGQFLTEAGRAQLSGFPTQMPAEDLFAYFTLSPRDLEQIGRHRKAYNRLGFALQLCAVRYLGFVPDELSGAPHGVLDSVADQLGVSGTLIDGYGERAQTRSDHLGQILSYLDMRRASLEDLEHLQQWLLERALEHDKPTLLLGLACQKLQQDNILRPGLTILERLVMNARVQAGKRTFSYLADLLHEERRELLDRLLVVDEKLGYTPLSWLRRRAITNSPRAIIEALDKLVQLHHWGVHSWDLNKLSPNRIKFLAAMGRRSTNQALARASEQRRYSILVAFVHQSLVDITDEVIDMFDRCLGRVYARARRDLEEWRRKSSRSQNEQLRLLRLVADACCPEASEELEQFIDARLPLVELSDLLIEVDGWTQFTDLFEHASGGQGRSPGLLRHLHASVLAQACNLGLGRMEQIAQMGRKHLAWCTNWYLRYFGYGRGVTFYTWTSDQFSQYGTKVISSTVRDATYVLDAILDNETDLSIIEHTTDTAGYTDLLFALFDLLGMQFAPRIRNAGDTRLYRFEHKSDAYPRLWPCLTGKLNKGEALHVLRRFLFFGGGGKVKRKHLEEQNNQASCLSLVTNAVVTWNTVYMQAAIDEFRAQGHTIKDEQLRRLSPARIKHINPYGRYIFDVNEGLNRTGLRPLRRP